MIEGNLGRVRPRRSPETTIERQVAMPVMGRIAAGTPISAIQTRSHTITLPPDMLGGGRAFRARSARRFDDRGRHFRGDTVIIRKQDTAETGDIVVALIDDEEATLKRLRKRGASIALEAANPAYETRIFGPDRVRIQGKLVSLLRRY